MTLADVGSAGLGDHAMHLIAGQTFVLAPAALMTWEAKLSPRAEGESS
jgi:hypothetical protein